MGNITATTTASVVLLDFLLKDVVVSLLAGFVSGVALLISLRGGGVAATFTQSCTVILDTVSDRENCAIILSQALSLRYDRVLSCYYSEHMMHKLLLKYLSLQDAVQAWLRVGPSLVEQLLS